MTTYLDIKFVALSEIQGKKWGSSFKNVKLM